MEREYEAVQHGEKLQIIWKSRWGNRREGPYQFSSLPYVPPDMLRA